VVLEPVAVRVIVFTKKPVVGRSFDVAILVFSVASLDFGGLRVNCCRNTTSPTTCRSVHLLASPDCFTIVVVARQSAGCAEPLGYLAVDLTSVERLLRRDLLHPFSAIT